jgi:hypothetical protein
MRSTFLRLKWWCFSLLLFFVASCSLNLELKRPEGEQFLQETSRLEKLAREDPSTSVRAKSHLQIAFLYLNSRNPQLSYSRALQEMESYLSMSPAKAQKDELQNWLAVLKEMDRLSKSRTELEKQNQNLKAQIDKIQAALQMVRTEMEKQNQNLQAQIDKSQAALEKVRKANLYLRDEVATLKETNNIMIETIEKLKILDLQMEEQRRLIK